MTARQRRYPNEILAQRGQELYESSIRQQVEAKDEGKIVAIDLKPGSLKSPKHLWLQLIVYLNISPMLSLGLFGSDIAPFIILVRGA